jgi:tetratricopeptide (TPR) repeat protein
VDPDELRKQLGATYVLSGSVEQVGRRLNVIAELTCTQTHGVIWSDGFAGQLEDIFQVRQEITGAVVNAVEHQVPLSEASLFSRTPTENLDAWGHYHLGIRHLYRFTDGQNEMALQCFAKALELDPCFARAHAGLAFAEIDRRNLWRGPEVSPELTSALKHAEIAVDTDPLDPFCNVVLGQAKWIDQRLDEAISQVDRSLDLNPHYSFAHYQSGKFNAIACEGHKADHHIEMSFLLSPIDPNIQSMLSAYALSSFAQDAKDRALSYASQSAKAHNAHMFVFVIAAAIFFAYGDRKSAAKIKRRIDGLSSKFVPEHFFSLFKLKDTARNAVFADAIAGLELHR